MGEQLTENERLASVRPFAVITVRDHEMKYLPAGNASAPSTESVKDDHVARFVVECTPVSRTMQHGVVDSSAPNAPATAETNNSTIHRFFFMPLPSFCFWHCIKIT